ncbi:MAG: prepilin peptidase [Candidatus Omnitrophica bacterium]|nr:prepilin peptidase [Candidatus Omnitrophota bacterium]
MIIVLSFIIGAISGSFMNVCIYRLPRKESVVRPRSHCPSCARAIPWYDNVPILSFLMLAGKCRFCKKRISVVYPIVEILSGLICVLLFLTFGLTVKFFILWYFLSALVVVSFIDLRIHEIPDEITLSGIALGMVAAALYPPLLGKVGHLSSLLDSFLGVIVGGGSIYLLGFIGEFIFKKEAMGGGDVKLLAMIGAFLGWKLAIFTFFLAPLSGSIVGITLKIKKGEEIIPYGPHLSLAAVIALFYGERLLRGLFF